VLQTRWLWLEHTQSELPWVVIQGKTDVMIVGFFKDPTRWLLGDGNSMSFWSVSWLDGQSIEELVPKLVAAASCGPHHSRSVASALEGYCWIRDITGAPYILGLIQYLQLGQRLEEVVIQPSTSYRLIWKWSTFGQFSMSLAYAALFHGQAAITSAATLWKSKASGKC
jgi:hypothetical protein